MVVFLLLYLLYTEGQYFLSVTRREKKLTTEKKSTPLMHASGELSSWCGQMITHVHITPIVCPFKSGSNKLETHKRNPWAMKTQLLIFTPIHGNNWGVSMLELDSTPVHANYVHGKTLYHDKLLHALVLNVQLILRFCHMATLN